MLISSEQIGEITPEKCEYEIVENLTRSTSLQGYSVEATYSQLKQLSGKPSFSSGDPYDKVNIEWCIEGKIFFTDEYGETDYEYVEATVYNWKTGMTPTEEYQWHIGGHGYEAVDFVDAIIKGEIQPYFNLND